MAVAGRGPTRVAYRIRRSRRARRLRIVVDAAGVTAVAPTRMPEREIDGFVASRAAWIRARRAELRRRHRTVLPPRLVPGARVPLRGDELEVVLTSGSRGAVRRNGETIEIRLPETTPPGRVEAEARGALSDWLRRQAAHDAARYVERHAPRLGSRPAGIRIKDQKTLWGSCGITGILNLNWRLVAAPPEVFEYVVAHELCHLVRRDHSPPFWELLEGLLPGYREPRRWLKENGLSLS